MQIYADLPAVRARQIVADALALGVAVVAIAAGIAVGSLIAGLAEIGRRLESAGSGFGSTMSDAGATLGGIPLVGDAVRAPFDEASGAGSVLAAAGRDQQQLAGTLAVVAGLAVGGLPVLLLALLWLRPRLRFVRRTAQLRALGSTAAGSELLALRALTQASPREILAAHPEAVTGWRRGDPAATAALAALSLRRSGLRVR
ncbi:hypothetical protein C5E02_12420 [Rathayibacter rathayi]|uniref:Transmembrane protein n=1 Tax=Rathayibacter rathayi TaxID=33887 RepID=A0ABD6W8F3_RATRA|nr:hypothetical protein [Rathayibacter rathayi]AZZ49944.1 hypothetical protein C1O28_12760 [Rathayibacter rathayi]MWV75228.1 hypothetical protein [Rathayibacter rathayi NCPPB 2980 = VKM Ac-1601]PPF13942.1 hypothetical protein C5C04_08210 [Rathayibacter rathayi]PPF48642.1 hypothetical protein C5C08_08620 [Rathayibacter rathayi]PPF79505.1 hypothetical protein C5C14_08715 [Rathayibacter rathayi]